MKLPPRDRVRLSQELVTTFDDSEEGSLEEIAAIWLAEAESRFAELRGDGVQGIAAEEVFHHARETLRKLS